MPHHTSQLRTQTASDGGQPLHWRTKSESRKKFGKSSTQMWRIKAAGSKTLASESNTGEIHITLRLDTAATDLPHVPPTAITITSHNYGKHSSKRSHNPGWIQTHQLHLLGEFRFSKSVPFELAFSASQKASTSC